MDSDQRELIRHLFATATALAETAHEASVEGQADNPGDAPYRAAARRLLAASRDLQVLAQAITVMIEPGSQTNHL